LADLREFAQKSGLPALEQQLRVSTDIANLEIASIEGMAQDHAQRGIANARAIDRPAARGRNF
jgi:hypothetical protein